MKCFPCLTRPAVASEGNGAALPGRGQGSLPLRENLLPPERDPAHLQQYHVDGQEEDRDCQQGGRIEGCEVRLGQDEDPPERHRREGSQLLRSRRSPTSEAMMTFASTLKVQARGTARRRMTSMVSVGKVEVAESAAGQAVHEDHEHHGAHIGRADGGEKRR